MTSCAGVARLIAPIYVLRPATHAFGEPVQFLGSISPLLTLLAYADPAPAELAPPGLATAMPRVMSNGGRDYLLQLCGPAADSRRRPSAHRTAEPRVSSIERACSRRSSATTRRVSGSSPTFACVTLSAPALAPHIRPFASGSHDLVLPHQGRRRRSDGAGAAFFCLCHSAHRSSRAGCAEIPPPHRRAVLMADRFNSSTLISQAQPWLPWTAARRRFDPSRSRGSRLRRPSPA